MALKLDDLLEAQRFSNAMEQEMGQPGAWIDLETGDIPWATGDSTQQHKHKASRYLPVPSDYELGLGSALVFNFVQARAPQEADKVRGFFRKKGAYARFSDWADQHDLRDAWHAYREQSFVNALLAWCEEHGIKVIQADHPT